MLTRKRRAHVAIKLEEEADIKPKIKVEKSEKEQAENKTIVKAEKLEKKEEETEEKMAAKVVPKELPAFIAKHVENIRAMRSDQIAPVDTMGCDQLFEKKADEKTKRYQILLSLMLSSQTKDAVTHDAMGRLKEKGCTMETIKKTPESDLAEILKPVGMYRKKANFIKRTTEILMEKYDSDIPGDVKSLCSLPGVGPKMAMLAMETGWGVTAGIAVDTHVHRISNWLKWIGNKPTRTPEQTRAKLEEVFPKDMWPEINHLLVGFGQTICKPVNPLCSRCLNVDICPVGKKTRKTSGYFKSEPESD